MPGGVGIDPESAIPRFQCVCTGPTKVQGSRNLNLFGLSVGYRTDAPEISELVLALRWLFGAALQGIDWADWLYSAFQPAEQKRPQRVPPALGPFRLGCHERASVRSSMNHTAEICLQGVA